MFLRTSAPEPSTPKTKFIGLSHSVSYSNAVTVAASPNNGRTVRSFMLRFFVFVSAAISSPRLNAPVCIMAVATLIPYTHPEHPNGKSMTKQSSRKPKRCCKMHAVCGAM